MDLFDLLAVQGTSLLHHHSPRTSIFWCSAFFVVQLSHPYLTTGKTIALPRWTLVGKVMSLSLLFNMLSRFVIPAAVFLPGESQGQGALWAAVYGVAQSRTQLKQLSSKELYEPGRRDCVVILCFLLNVSLFL